MNRSEAMKVFEIRGTGSEASFEEEVQAILNTEDVWNRTLVRDWGELIKYEGRYSSPNDSWTQPLTNDGRRITVDNIADISEACIWVRAVCDKVSDVVLSQVYGTHDGYSVLSVFERVEALQLESQLEGGTTWSVGNGKENIEKQLYYLEQLYVMDKFPFLFESF